RTRQSLAQPRGLFDPLKHEMLCVDARAAACMFGHVSLFVFERHFASRHAMIFEAERATRAVCMQVRAQIFVWRVPAHVTIKLTIIWIARIADNRTPDLLTRLHVARKYGEAV